MELLLANHPLDCPICDQAGECSLQEFSVEHGKGESRFREQKVKKPKNVDVGPRIRLDDERCIMCSRCIRFMDEVADDPVLGPVTVAGVVPKLSQTPGSIRWAGRKVGADTRAVMTGELGLDDAELEAMAEAGIIAGDGLPTPVDRE